MLPISPLAAGIVAALTLALLSGCSPAGDPAAGDSPAGGTPGGEPVTVVVDGVSLQVDVADTQDERSQGLRGRPGVPPGTGMVFLYDEPTVSRYTMSGVTFPLVAVWVDGDTVVGVEQMEPCAGSLSECPVYGPDAEADAVVEAAPESLPDVEVGDPVELSRA